MSKLNATERLRQLLDERGVEWHGTGSVYGDDFDAIESVWKDDALDVTLYGVSPEHAVEAMLGRGTCKVERHGSLADWPDMVCWSCSECSFGWHHSINDKQFTYCPNCGRKIES